MSNKHRVLQLEQRLPQPSEKQIQQGVKDTLKRFGFRVWDTSQPFRAAITPGLSDLIAMGRGVVVFIECKSEMGRLTRAQRMFRDAVRENGGQYLEARSSADVVRWVESLPKRSALT